MCRETLYLQSDEAFESFRDYVMGLIGVDFVRNICKGIWGRTSEDSEIAWHDQGNCVVRETVDRRNVDQKNTFFGSGNSGL